METTGPLSGSPPLTPARTEAVNSAWQVGQILRAVTLSSSPGGQTLLQIGTQTVQGQSPIPLAAGQTVSLQVEGLSPQPLLRILPAPGQDPVGDAVRTLLPRQGGLAPLYNNLVQLTNARPALLPPLLQELSRNLLRQAPDSRSVGTAPGLRQAVAQSGLFQEARLLAARNSGRVNLDSDLKTNLLRLVQLVRNWPGLGDAAPGARTAASPSPAGTPGGSPTVPTPPPPAGVPLPPRPATQPSTAPTAPAATPPTPGQGTAANPPLPPTGATLPRQGNPLPPAPGGPQAPGARPPATATPVPSGSPGSGPPAPSTPQVAAPAVPATLGRALRAAAALPAGGSAPTPPAAPPAAPASALARVLLTTGLGLPHPPPPPLRGQPPLPQARTTASLQSLPPAPVLRTELLQQAEASVARLQLHQLASLPQPGRDTGMEWLLDLPVRRGEETDVWSLGIRRDEDRGGREAERQGPLWTVQLAFDLPGLGPMQARVSLRGEQVSTWFWATREETLPLLRAHLQDLRRELETNGLRVAELHCLRGPMPGDTEAAAARPPILDERV